LEAEAHVLGLALLVRALKPSEMQESGSAGGRTHTLVLYGADKPGLVHRVAETAAQHGLNIIDLRSQLTGTEQKPLYS
jgi:glycine cleavage system transcriptional repressor